MGNGKTVRLCSLIQGTRTLWFPSFHLHPTKSAHHVLHSLARNQAWTLIVPWLGQRIVEKRLSFVRNACVDQIHHLWLPLSSHCSHWVNQEVGYEVRGHEKREKKRSTEILTKSFCASCHIGGCFNFLRTAAMILSPHTWLTQHPRLSPSFLRPDDHPSNRARQTCSSLCRWTSSPRGSGTSSCTLPWRAHETRQRIWLHCLLRPFKRSKTFYSKIPRTPSKPKIAMI